MPEFGRSLWEDLITNTFDGQYPAGPILSPLREHDTSNYGLSFYLRGKASAVTSNGVSTSRYFDETGSPTRIMQGGYNVDVTAAIGIDNAVPGILTPNSNTDLQSTLSWSPFLGLQSRTDSNASTSST